MNIEKGNKLLVCGGREYTDREYMFRKLDAVRHSKKIDSIIHGACRGAALLAEEWAKSRRIPYVGIPARWDKYGRAAGHIRNCAMLDMSPTFVVAFHDSISEYKETKYCIDGATKRDIPVKVYIRKYETNSEI